MLGLVQKTGSEAEASRANVSEIRKSLQSSHQVFLSALINRPRFLA